MAMIRGFAQLGKFQPRFGCFLFFEGLMMVVVVVMILIKSLLSKGLAKLPLYSPQYSDELINRPNN